MSGLPHAAHGAKLFYRGLAHQLVDALNLGVGQAGIGFGEGDQVQVIRQVSG